MAVSFKTSSKTSSGTVPLQPLPLSVDTVIHRPRRRLTVCFYAFLVTLMVNLFAARCSVWVRRLKVHIYNVCGQRKLPRKSENLEIYIHPHHNYVNEKTTIEHGKRYNNQCFMKSTLKSTHSKSSSSAVYPRTLIVNLAGGISLGRVTVFTT